ncbi:class I SAM-dependent methyltransferase [Acutalibacter sp. 1XD8-36]|uniref:class I SAM-dependent methyltransferase n=1 Tax=Acutalibacter sp. 1XD8-36 TaxID=2320852 RepID=UPI0026184423|nr:class I SAM-dependent methyltransferase [Acutalibacter sp. 1XD8-36]
MTNEYDDPKFFEQYSQMPRSRQGLKAAGEWHQLKELFPDVSGSSVLDLGCGYGWHCRYAAEQGAVRVLGLDISEKMLAEAGRSGGEDIEYRLCGIEDYEYPADEWDIVVSNLALHYIENLEAVYQKVFTTLKPGGVFLFNIEHPVFTSGVGQDWVYDADGAPLYWPIDGYFLPGERVTNFLGCKVKKQHHTLTQIINGLLCCGFTLTAVEEAQPPEEMLGQPGMADELRRPMMLLVRAEKKQ